MDRTRQTLREITSAHHQTLNTNQNGCEEARAPEAHHFVSLDRQDSGLGDVWKPRFKVLYHPQPPDKAMAPSSPVVSTIRHNVKLSENIAPQHTAQRTSTHKRSRQSSSQELGIDVSANSRRPRSITPHSSRRGTTVTSSLPSSNTSSRKSSVASHNKRPHTAARRSSSAGYGRPCTEDTLALHRQSVQLFPPFSNTLNPPSLGSRRHTSPTITPISPISRRHQTASQHSIDQTGPETLGDGPHQYENFVPASSIDWTQPSTRQREYRKIDQSHRGLRGLWRRLTPRWCHRKSRHLDFFREDDKYDTGSVRRYRIDMAGNEDRTKCGSGEEELETNRESCPSKTHRLRRYLSFSRGQTTPMRDSEPS